MGYVRGEIEVENKEGREMVGMKAYLIRSITSQAANSRLDSTRSRVDVGLKGGCVLVRHDCVRICFVRLFALG